jgi:AAA15 family ATPase/GTPase
LVGDNEAGKSTILEAIHLALSGLFGGRYLKNELPQYVFNNAVVEDYITKLNDAGAIPIPPHILISIYPNPTTSFLNIVDKDNQLQNATIQIKNYLGQIVLSSPFTSQINLQNLSAGMYFLTVKDKDYLKTFKIIRE